MKLAIFTGGDLRTFGGGERWALELINRLSINTSIFSYKEKNNLRITKNNIRKLPLSEVHYYNVFTIPILKERIPMLFSWLKVITILREYQIIYNLDPSLFTNLFLLFFSKLNHKKYIFGMHSEALRDAPLTKNLLKSLALKLYKKFRNFILLRIPNIHVLTKEDQTTLKNLRYSGSLFYIPHFIYFKINSNKINCNSKKFIVLFVGRLSVYHKGIDLLAAIINKTLHKNDKIQFHIVGTGKEGNEVVSELSKQFPNNVKWLKFIPDNKLIAEYNKSNLFVFTSRYETFGLSLLEAQTYGLPAISFKEKGPSEILKKKYQGILINPYFIDDFSDEILKFYKSWKANKYMYLKNKKLIIKFINKNFSAEKLIKEFEGMLRAAKY